MKEGYYGDDLKHKKVKKQGVTAQQELQTNLHHLRLLALFGSIGNNCTELTEKTKNRRDKPRVNKYARAKVKTAN